MSIATLPPTARREALVNALALRLGQCLRRDHLAVTSPRRARQHRREMPSIISGNANRRRLRASKPEKIAHQRLTTRRARARALTALACSPRASTGLRIRRRRSALSAISAAQLPCRSLATVVERLALVGEIEQRRRVTLAPARKRLPIRMPLELSSLLARGETALDSPTRDALPGTLSSPETRERPRLESGPVLT